jgi:adenine-specific DNA-methyltransferase
MASTEGFHPEDGSPAANVMRPIHYLGNKSRILNSIEAAIGLVAPKGTRICDLFAGSGVVSRHLASRGPIMAVDIQEYSRVLSSALLNPQCDSDLAERILEIARPQEKRTMSGQLRFLAGYERQALDLAEKGDPEQLSWVIDHGSLWRFEHQFSGSDVPEELVDALSRVCTDIDSTSDTAVTRYYAGVYFSYEQAATLDSIASAVRTLPNELRDTAMAAVLSTASELVVTVGNHFAQPIRPRNANGSVKSSFLKGVATKRRRSAKQTFLTWLGRYQSLAQIGSDHIVVRQDFRDALSDLPEDTGVIYADPPYTRDHYSRFYHVLETLAIGDEPGVSMMNLGGEVQPSRALYRRERHQSPFCIRSQVVPAFRALFSGASGKGVPLVLSYSPFSPGTAARPETRLISIADLTQLAGEYFAEVSVKSAGYVTHSKFNAERFNATAMDEAEIFVIAR